MTEDKLRVGDKVRVLRGPHKGKSGIVNAIDAGSLDVVVDGGLLCYLFSEVEVEQVTSVSRTAETITTFALEDTGSGLHVRCKISSLSPHFFDTTVEEGDELPIDLCVSRATAEAIVEVLTRALENDA